MPAYSAVIPCHILSKPKREQNGPESLQDHRHQRDDFDIANRTLPCLTDLTFLPASSGLVSDPMAQSKQDQRGHQGIS